MPVVTITLIEGYDEAVREAMAQRLTAAVKATIDAPLDGITVIINEVAPADYMRGGQRRVPGPAPVPPAETVLEFLRSMEARDLDAARASLADDFEMIFPGDARMRSLEDLVAWAAARYRDVRKTIERVDEAPTADATVVYCHGTLSGTWPDGEPFAGVRFVDRFTVRGGKLADQRVWNDLGEARVARATR